MRHDPVAILAKISLVLHVVTQALRDVFGTMARISFFHWVIRCQIFPQLSEPPSRPTPLPRTIPADVHDVDRDCTVSFHVYTRGLLLIAPMALALSPGPLENH